MFLDHLRRSFASYSENLAHAVIEMATGQCELGLRRVDLVRDMLFERGNVLEALLAEERSSIQPSLGSPGNAEQVH